MENRVTVTERQLAAAIAGWLRKVPKKVWDELIEHKILALYKRQNQEPRLDSEIAQVIAAEMTRLDWQVTQPENKNFFSD